ncbi:hypothetical protein [Dyadobacter luticola]|uniref:Uncharacterized protein n=1 Tax=Dyadobacter luticola TaxID=1979387 RepID=A0A5R9L2Q4_9BACT|nr:hypothetical protein [Dyadobacter luticola]TLV02701.1 hypothetical protein FEN17_03520 [Dyadobacter luticola]
MKKFSLILLLLSTTFAINSCSHKEKVKPEEEDNFTMEEFNKYLRRVPFIVAKAYKLVGKDTLDLLKDPIYKEYNEAVFLAFFDGPVLFYGGREIPNTKFKASARTFTINNRISLPTNLKYYWDEKLKTVVVESEGTSSYFPIIPSGKKAMLDKKKFDLNHTFEEDQNAAHPSSMTFTFEDYVIEMRPMWQYYKQEGQQVFADFVVF